MGLLVARLPTTRTRGQVFRQISLADDNVLPVMQLVGQQHVGATIEARRRSTVPLAEAVVLINFANARAASALAAAIGSGLGGSESGDFGRVRTRDAQGHQASYQGGARALPPDPLSLSAAGLLH